MRGVLDRQPVGPGAQLIRGWCPVASLQRIRDLQRVDVEERVELTDAQSEGNFQLVEGAVTSELLEERHRTARVLEEKHRVAHHHEVLRRVLTFRIEDLVPGNA